MVKRLWLVSFGMSVVIAGCGPGKTVLPTKAFTEEQIQKIKQEDLDIEDEESQGKSAGGKLQKKKK